MTVEPILMCRIDAPELWKMHRLVWGGGGVSPCITTRMDFAPWLLVEARE